MNIGIIGLGLIGGSIARATMKYTDNKVYGFDIDENAIIKAEMMNAIVEPINENNVKDIDMIIVALNLSPTIKVLEKICPYLKDGAIVTDICGVKRPIIEVMQTLSEKYPNLKFCGVHPMAGREFSGISHSSANLFERAYIVIVPIYDDIEVLAKIKSFYKSILAQDVQICNADYHDRMIAYTSQLAHIVSSAYIKDPNSSEHAGFSAGSFRDLTRVAKLNPNMWDELFMANKDNLVECIDNIIKELTLYRNSIENEDQNLRELLQDGVDKKELAEQARKDRLK